jgi:hypothetical protein
MISAVFVLSLEWSVYFVDWACVPLSMRGIVGLRKWEVIVEEGKTERELRESVVSYQWINDREFP